MRMSLATRKNTSSLQRAALVLALTLGICLSSALLRCHFNVVGFIGGSMGRHAPGYAPGVGGQMRRLHDDSVKSTSGSEGNHSDASNHDVSLFAALLNGFGMFYMIIALYIVCDEFFVPSLGILSAIIGADVTDVVGGTFMATGDSVPEFFTSLVCALRPVPSTVGMAAIVGSAVFNVLAVIGVCGLVASKSLQLKWYPLARDSIFYLVALGGITWAFQDGQIDKLEASSLISLYIFYIFYMICSAQIEKYLTGRGRFALCDTDHDGRLTREEAAKDEQFCRHFDCIDNNKDGMITLDEVEKFQNKHLRNYFKRKAYWFRNSYNDTANNDISEKSATSCDCKHVQKTTESQDSEEPILAKSENEDEAISIYPPEHANLIQLLWYVFKLPLVLVLILTIPDVRRKGCWRNLYVPCFLLSMVWIAIFSYFMIEFTEVVGAYTKIPTTILALTILAWGNCVPDLIMSIIVTRQGHGDMAVASSIGSNIFDITVGLPVPWLIFSAVRGGAFPVGQDGLGTSIIMLIGMLVFTMGSIMLNKWVLNKWLGLMMLALWICFTAYNIYERPTL